MSITIKTQKVIDDQGNQAYKILAISALGEKELPFRYRNDPQAIWLVKDEDESYLYAVHRFGTMNHPSDTLYVGCAYTVTDWQAALNVIRTAGQALHEENARLKKLAAEWHGEETFII